MKNPGKYPGGCAAVLWCVIFDGLLAAVIIALGALWRCLN